MCQTVDNEIIEIPGWVLGFNNFTSYSFLTTPTLYVQLKLQNCKTYRLFLSNYFFGDVLNDPCLMNSKVVRCAMEHFEDIHHLLVENIRSIYELSVMKGWLRDLIEILQFCP